MLLVMRLGDRERSGTGWTRRSVSFRRAMPLMVVDGAAGDSKASTSSGMWSAGR
jgi:hypothetical protein